MLDLGEDRGTGPEWAIGETWKQAQPSWQAGRCPLELITRRSVVTLTASPNRSQIAVGWGTNSEKLESRCLRREVWAVPGKRKMGWMRKGKKGQGREWSWFSWFSFLFFWMGETCLQALWMTQGAEKEADNAQRGSKRRARPLRRWNGLVSRAEMNG